jgi:low temperature requirement protein LtrA
MYDGFAWLSNNIGPTTASTRLPMLVAMAAFLVVAISVPHAFDDERAVFAGGYLVIVLVHGVSFLRSSVGSSARAILAIAPINLGICAGLGLAAVLPEGRRWWGWALAVLLPFVSLLRQAESGFTLRPEHFAERHRLMLIIALGESVLAVGLAAQGQLTDPAHLGAVVLALVLVSLLWWVHFADDDAVAKVDEVVDRPEGMPARTALVSFSLGYLVLVAGLILVAAALQAAVHDVTSALGWRAAATMAAGVATYLAGNAFHLWRLGVTGRRRHVALAAAALLAAPVGHLTTGLAEMALLAVVLLAAVVRLTATDLRQT